MAIATNKDTVTAFLDSAMPNPVQIPDEIGKTYVPILDVTPRKHRIINLISSTSSFVSGTMTAITASSTKDTYITGIWFGMTKDATCDVADGVLTVSATVNGRGYNLKQYAVLTLTAQTYDSIISLDPPLKIDKGSVMQVNGTFTVGKMGRTISVVGYEVDHGLNS